MSLPISACQIIRACKDDQDYEFLLKRFRYNLNFGSMTIADCSCDPPCDPPSNEQLTAFEERLAKDLEKKKSA